MSRNTAPIRDGVYKSGDKPLSKDNIYLIRNSSVVNGAWEIQWKDAKDGPDNGSACPVIYPEMDIPLTRVSDLPKGGADRYNYNEVANEAIEANQ